MSINEELEAIDLQCVIDKMTLYAIYRLRSNNVKSFIGKEPYDFVGEVLLKALEQQRDWEKAKCTIEEFLLGCLKSEISNFFVRKQVIITDQVPEDVVQLETYSVNEEKEHLLKLLTDAGADDEEQILFELWSDGLTKSNLIASELGIPIMEVYKITRRLERRLSKIKIQVKNIL
jgi:DNA-directed RNA polymerase specialized sigma24 family protein